MERLRPTSLTLKTNSRVCNRLRCQKLMWSGTVRCAHVVESTCVSLWCSQKERDEFPEGFRGALKGLQTVWRAFLQNKAVPLLQANINICTYFIDLRLDMFTNAKFEYVQKSFTLKFKSLQQNIDVIHVVVLFWLDSWASSSVCWSHAWTESLKVTLVHLNPSDQQMDLFKHVFSEEKDSILTIRPSLP